MTRSQFSFLQSSFLSHPKKALFVSCAYWVFNRIVCKGFRRLSVVRSSREYLQWRLMEEQASRETKPNIRSEWLCTLRGSMSQLQRILHCLRQISYFAIASLMAVVELATSGCGSVARLLGLKSPFLRSKVSAFQHSTCLFFELSSAYSPCSLLFPPEGHALQGKSTWTMFF